MLGANGNDGRIQTDGLAHSRTRSIGGQRVPGTEELQVPTWLLCNVGTSKLRNPNQD